MKYLAAPAKIPYLITFIRLAIILFIISLLFKTDLFVNTFYNQVFSYKIIASVIITATGLLFITQKNVVNYKPSSLLFVLFIVAWCIYVLLNSHLFNFVSHIKPRFLIISLICCVSLTLFLNNSQYKKTEIFSWIIVVSAIQSAFCIFQFFDLKSENGIYKVSGTWINPNITAIYLALTIPIIFYNILEVGIRKKITYLVLFIAVFFAIILLKSRTAIIGTSLSILLLTEWRFRIMHSIFHKRKMYIKVFISIVIILLFFLLGVFAYKARVDSSDSRLFIWKLSFQLFQERQVLGYGYGSFEKNYNLYQADFFQRGFGSADEKRNAAHTKMAYNEFIENAVEGGIIGLAFFTLFLFYLIRRSYFYIKRNKYFYFDISNPSEPSLRIEQKIAITSGVAVVSLFCMSFMNFTILAVPVMLLFVLFSSLILSLTSEVGSTISPKYFLKYSPILLIFTGVFFLFNSISTTYYQKKIRDAVNLGVDKDYNTALAILESIPEGYRQTGDYYQTLAHVFYYSKDNENARVSYENASEFMSTPELYQQIGNSYSEVRNSNMAIEKYEIAKNIQPNRFTPRFLLLTEFIKMKDSSNAVRLANEIVSMEVKVPSQKIDMYKKVSRDFINKISK